MPEGLSEKVIIVTGATSGIGRAASVRFAEEGASVVAVGRSEDRLASLADHLGDRLLPLAVDVTVPGSSDDILARTIDRFGRVDAVIANAGLYLAGDVGSVEEAEIRALIDTNVTAAFALVRAALAHMVPAGHGDIVLTSSVSGHQSISWEPVYTASKHAVQAFVHAVRRQTVASGVRVGAVAPGVVANELWGKSEAEADAMVASGEGMRSEDVAEAMLFMLTRPDHVTIRDLVMLPRAQEI